MEKTGMDVGEDSYDSDGDVMYPILFCRLLTLEWSYLQHSTLHRPFPQLFVVSTNLQHAFTASFPLGYIQLLLFEISSNNLL